MTGEQYARIKAAKLAVDRAHDEARLMLAGPQAVYAEALRQVGLNPAEDYRLDDATQAVLPVTPQGHGDA